MLRTRRGAVREGYYGLPTLGLTRSYIDAPYVCMDDLRGAARKVEWVPDVRTGAEQVRPPTVADVDRVRPERQVVRVLRVPGAGGRGRDILLR